MAWNIERAIAFTTDWLAFVTAPQVLTQWAANTLARRDIRNAIENKCGAAGASNQAELEKQLIGSSTPHAYRTRFFLSRFFPNWQGVPVFPRNPYVLPFALGLYSDSENKAAWTLILYTGALIMSDAYRGFAGLSRVPLLQNWSRIGSGPYQTALSNTVGNIQCNPSTATATAPAADPATATAPEGATAAEPAAVAAPEAAPTDAPVPLHDPSVAMPPPEAKMIAIPVQGESLAAVSARVYGTSASPVSLHQALSSSGHAAPSMMNSGGIPLVGIPFTPMGYTMPAFSFSVPSLATPAMAGAGAR